MSMFIKIFCNGKKNLMIKILSWNINGFRSILSKGFFEEICDREYDIMCFQEVKLSDESVLKKKLPAFYYMDCNLSHDKGKSGVAILFKQKPQKVERTLGLEKFDKQGRFLQVDFEDFILINAYIPHGRRDKVELPYKLEVLNALEERIRLLSDKPVILTGDFNVARDDLDVCKPSQNKKNIMFTQAERDLINKICQIGYTDVFRNLYPDKREYTWWTYAYNARQRNIGWRIDYFFVSDRILPRVKDIVVEKKQQGSDHCPVTIYLK